MLIRQFFEKLNVLSRFELAPHTPAKTEGALISVSCRESFYLEHVPACLR